MKQRAIFAARIMLAYYKTLGIFGAGFLIGCAYAGFVIGGMR